MVSQCSAPRAVSSLARGTERAGAVQLVDKARATRLNALVLPVSRIYLPRGSGRSAVSSVSARQVAQWQGAGRGNLP